ncbi:DUF1338 domain-containing protein [Glaciecola sp. KUL10]|uniref:DUF1338 domain-containing protein n=1 Tax=Glaciecola sp. (strain KUL10) TaxID=2161813 RepID=UPI000D788042|nr:DUF1338 domain-containing protein [Glaciecola sp. KUL10]GBL03743.1 hypothetical protein KUL10_10430 [Glaciecola sp. KUL10]
MHKTIESLFAGLWQDYIQITPSAFNIHELLGNTSGQSDIVNDHIALRTFNFEKVNIEKLAKHFVSLGYEQKGEYNFEAKKLSAIHLEHPNPLAPKVFISELRVEELSEASQVIIKAMVEQLDERTLDNENFLYSGTHWDVSIADYKTLRDESEYAGWMAAWGYRANHFTVSVNHLNSINELKEVNNKLIEAGYKMNESGGLIKGGQDVCLAQSSTMADTATAKFADGELSIPSCFYEFAQRYKMSNGEYYQGFVAASADKIFESTNAS